MQFIVEGYYSKRYSSSILWIKPNNPLTTGGHTMTVKGIVKL